MTLRQQPARLVMPRRRRDLCPYRKLKMVTASANRLILAPDERSLQVDLLPFDCPALAVLFDTFTVRSLCLAGSPGVGPKKGRWGRGGLGPISPEWDALRGASENVARSVLD
jgi:hypothetical protein